MYDILLEKAQQGDLSDEEILFISQALEQATRLKDDVNLPYLLHILGLAAEPSQENRMLVEKYLIYPEYPLASKEALRTLCRYWGLTSDYLAHLKDFIRGVEWDTSDEVRLSAMFIAGEFLMDQEDKELLELLLEIFESLGKSKKVHETRRYARALLKASAYEAIARAMGQDWDEIPNGIDIENAIEEERWDLLDFNLIKKVQQSLKE